MEIARYLIAFVAVFNFGGLIADAIVPASARQHLFNPHWPPHAKFHNAQTMLMGIVSGSLSLVILFGTRKLTLPVFLLAAAIAANYFATMALAPLFPKTEHTPAARLGPAAADYLRNLRYRSSRYPTGNFQLASGSVRFLTSSPRTDRLHLP
jgi:hypothetical protein